MRYLLFVGGKAVGVIEAEKAGIPSHSRDASMDADHLRGRAGSDQGCANSQVVFGPARCQLVGWGNCLALLESGIIAREGEQKC